MLLGIWREIIIKGYHFRHGTYYTFNNFRLWKKLMFDEPFPDKLHEFYGEENRIKLFWVQLH